MLYKLDKVNLNYKLNKRTLNILSNLDLQVNEGEFLVLMGPSGSGKTSILNIMAGFLAPTSGRVFYKDLDLYSLNPTSIVSPATLIEQ